MYRIYLDCNVIRSNYSWLLKEFYVFTKRSLSQIKDLILQTLEQEGNLSSYELAVTMGYTKVTATVLKAIKELMNEQKVAYLEPNKVRTRNQKICLI